MSAVTDEAEDGPLRLNDDDNRNDERASQGFGNERTQEEELLTPRLSKPNGFEEEDDSLASNNDVEEFGPLQTSSPGPERPSSADGSLSIPDDTPSLQVRSMCRRQTVRPYSDCSRALSNLPLQAEGLGYPIMAEVQHLPYGPLISASKHVYLIRH